jgi:molybdopterin/thiamine biosynthesis adenylyltransferase/rhodanese-related sulfurtransferase
MGDVSPRDYYGRQLKVPGWGEAGQEALGRATVLVVGAGGLGCPALAALARSGVGRIVVCDPDRVEASNLPRQTLFTPADLGRRKVEAAAEALCTANPWLTVEALDRRVDASNVRALVEDADLVIEGADNFAVQFLVHDACRSAGVPLVAGAVHQWEAQVTVFDFRHTGPGCWRCLYPEAPADGCVGVCADTGVSGALTGMAGQMMALAALRVLLDLEGPPACSTLVIDGTDGTTRRLTWKPDPKCACASGAGDWSWLRTEAPAEAPWHLVALEQRTVVVDLREPQEIAPGDWEFFRQAGSRVVHARWARWADEEPAWAPEETYLLVCARGIRSLAALETVPTGIRALSLAGGIAGLG